MQDFLQKYFFRYLDPHNEEAFASPEALKTWMPVDFYLGGPEHVNGHLLYSRFFTKVLFDAGYSNVDEPFSNLLTQGMVIKDGAKMSKSRGNVVDPDDIVNKYGADTARLFILFASPPTRELEWSDTAVEGAFRFLNRVYRLIESRNQKTDSNNEKTKKKTHQMIKAVTEDIESFSFNTAIAKLMELTNAFYDTKDDIGKWELEQLVLMLSPFAPHLAEELWVMLGNDGFVCSQVWPVFDSKIIIEDEMTIPVQVNGRLRDTIIVSVNDSKENIEKLALKSEKAQNFLSGKQVVKVIYVPKKLINFVVK